MTAKRKSFSEFGRPKVKSSGCEVCGKPVDGYVSMTLGRVVEGQRGGGKMVSKELFKACELHAVDLFEELLAMANDATQARRPRAVSE